MLAVYRAASKGHEYLCTPESSLRDGVGAVWRSWILPEVPEEEGGEEEGAKWSRPPPELPTIHGPNVLRDPVVFFHRVPLPGAFIAVPIQ